MAQAISTKSLTKKFGRREVLHGVDFSVEAGSVFGVIGPNGAGKTTTMRCLLDTIRPTSGEVRVLGKIWGISAALVALGAAALHRRDVGA